VRVRGALFFALGIERLARCIAKRRRKERGKNSNAIGATRSSAAALVAARPRLSLSTPTGLALARTIVRAWGAVFALEIARLARCIAKKEEGVRGSLK